MPAARAGNVEATKTATVKIDKTAPTIGHDFTPSTYTDGAWTNQNVTVTFECADQGGSTVASCTEAVTKSTEGAGQQVVGTATDGAGNSTTDTATVSIYQTKPVIEAKVDRSPNTNLATNGKGWYDSDVTVSYSASDALSGLASKSPNAVLGHGANQAASGAATDAAGNSDSAGVGGINVDKPKPELIGTAPSGWHNQDVTVTWNASDALSGLAGAVPAANTVTGEGDNLSATESVSDRADNDKTTTLDGIKIDRTKPTTLASVPDVPANGWYRSGAEVTLTGSDNLSGATTYYTINNATRQTNSTPCTVSAAGTNTVKFWSVDGAGNVEDAGAPLTLNIDGDARPRRSSCPRPPEAAGTSKAACRWHSGPATASLARASRRPTTRSTAASGGPTGSRSPSSSARVRTRSRSGASTSRATSRPRDRHPDGLGQGRQRGSRCHAGGRE